MKNDEMVTDANMLVTQNIQHSKMQLKLLEMEKLHLVWQEKTGRELRSPSHHIHTRMHSSTLRMIMDSKLHSWSASGIIHLKN